MTGIDKIQLWAPLNQVSVKDADSSLFGFNMTTRQGSGDLPHLLTDSRGKAVAANSMYHNSTLAQYSINARGLQVQFNPSKAAGHPYHLSGTGAKFTETVKAIAGQLQAVGISADLDQMKLVRIDLAKQAEMSLPFGNYIDAFRMLKGKRAKEQRQYPSGYIVGNTRWQTIGYDKGEELKQHHLAIDEKNLMRLETRWLKSAVVSAQFKLNTLPVLCELAPADLDNIYKTHLTTKYFPKQYEGEQAVMDFDTVIDQMKTAQNSYGRNWFIKYISAVSIDNFLLQLGGLEMVRKALLEVTNKQRASDYIKELTELLYFKSRLDAQTGQQTVASLLYEMQEKFVA
jgi:hypothetical protein